MPCARASRATARGSLRSNGIAGCVRAALGLIDAGLSVILEQGLWDPWGQETAARLLGSAGFFVVGVTCEPGVAESREAARSDRLTGLARQQRAEILASGMTADLVVDSTRRTPAELAIQISWWLATGPAPVALR